MSARNRLASAGLSSNAAGAFLGTVAGGLTATGSTQATALALPADICKFTTVAASTGAIIPPSNPGDAGQVYNGGANALLLYPPVGGIINGLSANAGYSVAAATPMCDWVCLDPLTYMATQGA